METSPGNKVLVTGVAGMLGRVVAEALSEAGYSVHGVDRVAPAKWDRSQRFTQANLQDWPQMAAAVADVDYVVHIAAIANLESAPEAEVFANNVTTTSNLIFAAAHSGIRRFVYASSQSALGFSRALSLIVPDYVPVDEDHVCRPTEGYGLSKLVGEQLCELATYRFGLPTLSLRFPVIWAPENFEQHVAKRVNDPEQAAKSMWSYVDVRDAAAAVVLGLAADLAPNVVFNISAPWPFCADAIGSLVRKYYGAVAHKREIGDRSPVYSVERAEKLLAFRARYRWTATRIEDTAADQVGTRLHSH